MSETKVFKTKMSSIHLASPRQRKKKKQDGIKKNSSISEDRYLPGRPTNVIQEQEDSVFIEKALTAYNAYVRCIQAFDGRMMPNFMSAYCHESIVLSVAWEHEKYLNGQMFMEIRGLQAVQSYLQTVCGIYPDTVLEFELTSAQALNPAVSYHSDCVVSSKVQFDAHQIYAINVSDLPCAFSEMEALSGLTSFIHSCSSSSTPERPDTSSDTECASSERSLRTSRSSSTSTPTHSLVSAESLPPHAQDSSFMPPPTQTHESFSLSESSVETHQLDSMSIFISTEHARFSRGRKYPSIIETKLRGDLRAYMNKDGQIVRLKYSF